MPQGLWVRVPLPVPRRRGRHIVRGDFFQKSPLTHFAAAPLQIEPAALGFDLVLGANLKAVASILLRCSKIKQSEPVLFEENWFGLFKDGFVSIGVGSNKMYESLCNVMGKPELAVDPRYLTNNLRIKNYVPHLRAEISEWCAEHTKAEIEAMLADVNVPCGPVLTVKDIFEHPHYKVREMLVDCDYPGYGNITIQGNVRKRHPGLLCRKN